MTDPQPLSPQDIELVEMMLRDSGLVRSGPQIVAILRDYQRVLAENAGLKRHLEQRASGNDPLTVQLRGRVEELEAEVAALRVAVESGERELQAVFLALNPDCPAYPGQPNTCDHGVCDCFGAMNMGQQVTALREQLRLATIAEATAEAEANDLRADKERLGRFAGKLLAQLRDGCTPDGGEMQDLLTEAEVIAPVQVTEPCKAEGCVCAEYGFPMACYRNTPLGNFCQNAARSGGEGTA